MVKMQDIATRAGVSIGTVSRALNFDETGVSQKKAREIRFIADQMGYKKKTRQSKSEKLSDKGDKDILIILSHSVESEMKNPYSTKIRISIENHLALKNYHYHILRLQQINLDSIRQLAGYQAILVVGMVPDTIAEALHDVTNNVIFIDSKPIKKYDFIIPDIEKGIEEYIELFIKNEIAKIGMITGRRTYLDEDGKKYFSEDPRLTTFKSILKRYGLYNGQYVVTSEEVDADFIVDGGYSISSGYRAMEQLIASNHLPDVVIAGCDVLAIGMIEALLEAGIQPGKDIGIVSFDNIDLAKYYKVPITTMDLNMLNLGELAVENMESKMNGRKLAVHIKIPLDLVIRASWQPNKK